MQLYGGSIRLAVKSTFPDIGIQGIANYTP